MINKNNSGLFFGDIKVTLSAFNSRNENAVAVTWQLTMK